MSVSEAPSNWLSEIIASQREAISRVVPFFEQRAERDAIRKRPQGAPLAANTNLADVIWAALGVANEAERTAKRNPGIKNASPAIQASWFVFGELGLPVPGVA